MDRREQTDLHVLAAKKMEDFSKSAKSVVDE